MKRALGILGHFLVGIGSFGVAQAQQVGLIPVPNFQNVQVGVLTAFDSSTQSYSYNYTLTNPATNTGNLRAIHVDITIAAGGVEFGGSVLSIPFGAQSLTFDDFVSQILAPLNPPPMVPVGMQVPSGWTGGLGVRGFALFAALDPTKVVAPGQTKSGFSLISLGPPTIRQIEFLPSWVFLVQDHDTIAPEDEQQADMVRTSLVLTAQTLGPSAVFPGSFAQWNQLRDDLNRAISLGWISDPVLAATLVAQLAAARQALDASDGTTAKSLLQTLLDTLNQASSSQIRPEANALVLLNVQALIANTPDTPIPFEPKVTFTPTSSTLPLGALTTLTASAINIGDPTTPPISGFRIGFRVSNGPNSGLFFFGSTGSDGTVSFSYTGQQLGTDKIDVFQNGETPTDFGSALVNWVGGPDLVIQLFVPPIINGGPGQVIPVTEITGNIGTSSAGSSVTRYFLSTNPVPDPTVDLALGERAVPALNPGDSNASGPVTLQLPPDLVPGTYYLGACADANFEVVELDETNNCRPTQVVVALKQTNQPPDCSKAQPDVTTLWPPNHKLATVSVLGIADPDGDSVTVSVTKITQDEPVNGLGDGDTSPDGFGVGTPQAQVRAERSGTGNGRVYAITVKADDGKGGTCSVTVSVGVPHDQGRGSVPIDDGQKYDSTLP